MSNTKKGQVCPLINVDSFDSWDNKEFTKLIMQEFKSAKGKNAVKYMARDLAISPDSVKNWLYKGNGMNAVQLFLIMRQYEFIRKIVINSLKK